jgi:putative chitinase
MNRFGNTLGKLGKQDELFGAYAGARDLELMTLKDSVKNREEQAKKEQEEQKNLKGATESYANMLLDKRKTREAAENFINAGINPVSSAMSKLTDVANKISGGAVGAAKGVGVGVSTPGTPTSGAPVAPPARTATTSQVERLVRDQLSTMGITSPRAVANIMAQIQAESGFKPQSENLNYSGRTLFEMFGAGNRYKNKERFANIDEANAVAARGPEAVGNILYGGRMGNALDEGFKYRGRGLIQLTGKDNYRKYSKLVGVDLVSNPDEANELGTAAKIAATYFVQAKKGGTDLENIKSVGKAVGYAGGEKETQKRAELAEGYMKGYKFGGIAKGPESGFETTLHGTEAVIPLPNGKTIPIDMPGMATSMRDQLAMISAQTSRLDDLISVMKKRNQISQKILQASKS